MNEKHFILDKTTIKIFKSANENFKSRGLKQTSLKEIAATAEVVRKTIYNRFKDRQDLVEKLINYSYSSILSLVNLRFYTDFNELLDKLAEKIVLLPIINSEKLRAEITEIYPGLKGSIQAAELSVIKQLATEIKNNHRLEYKLRASINPELAALIIWKIIIEKIDTLASSFSAGDLNVTYIREQIKDILFFGIFR